MACDWSDFHLIDNYQYDIVGSNTENVVTGRFWALSSDIDPTKLPQAGEAGPGALSGWYVDRCQAAAEDPLTYVVTVYFRNYLYLPTQVVRASASELGNDFRLEHSIDTFFISSDIMGLRRYRSGDISCSTTLGSWVPSEVDAATNKTVTEADWAHSSYVPDDCPFTKRPSLKYHNKTVKVAVARCIFNVAKASVSHVAFRGVNSSSNIPSGFDLDERTTAGKWLASQQKTVNIVSREGTAYRKVIRLLVHPPDINGMDGNKLTWDSNKVGGTFTW